ncbi:MAG: hypothetical protein JNM62_05020 [Flavobacteriales bacterium]|nr:hypothetical protein [Flavobacteriales bacterium]
MIAAIGILLNRLSVPWPALFGLVAFLIIATLLKRLLIRDFRKGIDILNDKKYEEALPVLERSAAFFKRYPWLDRYRYLLLLSSSAMSYREIVMVGRALCIGRTRSFAETDQAFKEVLREFPESSLAKITRRMMYANDTHH